MHLVSHTLFTNTMLSLLAAFPLVYKIRRAWLMRPLKQYLKKPEIMRLQQAIDILYAPPTYHHRIAHQDAKDFPEQGLALTYGEVNTIAFAQLLEITKPNSQDTFYDLGSGSGKAVFTAALLYPFEQCVGVELLPTFIQCCEHYTSVLHENSTIQMTYNDKTFPIKWINDDFMHLTLTKKSVVFVQCAAFMSDTMHPLTQKLAKLPKGSRIISASKPLNHSALKKIHEGNTLMSWGITPTYVYLVR